MLTFLKRKLKKDAVLLSPKEIDKDESKSIKLVHKEYAAGLEFLKKFDETVSFFGSARLKPEDEHYQQAYKLARKVVSELGYAVVTGGGPGIMEAANKGAFEAGGESIGIDIKLPHEQHSNPYVKHHVPFSYFFIRKTMLTFAAEAYVFFPGGFGTLDEFFDILTLVQTKKIPKVPMFLVGKDFWEPLEAYIQSNLLAKHNTISAEDTKLYKITDDQDEIIRDIKKAPVKNWWKDYEQE